MKWLYKSFLIFSLLIATHTRAAVFSSFRDQTGIQGSNLITASGLLDGFTPKEVLLISLEPYIGDMVIFEAAKITEAHRQFPNSKIFFLSPNASIVQPLKWFCPVSAGLPKPATSMPSDGTPESVYEPVMKVLRSIVKPTTLVIIDATTISKAANEFVDYCPNFTPQLRDKMRKQIVESFTRDLEQAIALGRGRLLTIGTNPYGWSSNIQNRYKKSQASGGDWTQRPGNWIGYIAIGNKTLKEAHFNKNKIRGWIRTELQPRVQNIYDVAEINLKQVWGDSAKFVRPVKLFRQSNSELSREARTYLKTHFVHPERPFIILNFNTGGLYKVKAVRRSYAKRAREYVRFIRKILPEYNIFITRSEKPFGENVSKSVSYLVQDYSGSLAFMPDDVKFWPYFFARADRIVTQDSGLTHVAAIHLDENRIFTFSVNHDGSSHWRRPEMHFGRFAEVYSHRELLMLRKFLLQDKDLISCPVILNSPRINHSTK